MVKFIMLIVMVALLNGCSLLYDIFHPLPPDHPDWQSGGGSVSPF